MAKEKLELAGETGVTLIMGQFRYGAGLTLDEAKANFKSQGGGLTRGLTLIEFGPRTEYHGVDQLGRFNYKIQDEKPGDGYEPYKMTEVQPGKRIPATR